MQFDTSITEKDEQEIRLACISAAIKILRPEIEYLFKKDEDVQNSEAVKTFLKTFQAMRQVERKMTKDLRKRKSIPKEKIIFLELETGNLFLTVVFYMLAGYSDKSLMTIDYDLSKSGFYLKALINTTKALQAYNSISLVMNNEEDGDYLWECNSGELLDLFDTQEKYLKSERNET